MLSAESDDRQLKQMLLRMDRSGYKAYKALRGSYQFLDFILCIDHVQGDPFAAPSQLRVKLSTGVVGFPIGLYDRPIRAIALEDFLIRRFDQISHTISQRRGTGKSGQIAIVRPSQAILKRSAATLNCQQEYLEMRFTVGLPAQGRQVLGRQAVELLCEDLPDIVEHALFYRHLNPKALQHHIEVAEDAHWLRQQLYPNGLVAFIANDAILARKSGVDDQPLPHAIPFVAPSALHVSFTCPNRGTVTGMGIPQGVTLIVGGGYHGKSTLLRAIEQGIYNHIPGDGREYVVSNPTALKVRAEEGRSIVEVNISPFLNHLPFAQSTTQFSTSNASGSTSQAANIIEGLEAGTQVLLMDEDTSATNFMIRDRRMQALIHKGQEPITPFIDKVQHLYRDYQVSTILVMGGSGDYFDVAETVIAMDNFQPQDVTAQAKAIAREYATDRQAEGGEQFGLITPRNLRSRQPQQAPFSKCKARGVNTILIDKDEIDLSAVEQLVEPGQLWAMAAALIQLRQSSLNGKASLCQILDNVMAQIYENGLDTLSPFPPSDFVEFRRFELAATLNRWRSLQIN